jgi:hypothetical protein
MTFVLNNYGIPFPFDKPIFVNLLYFWSKHTNLLVCVYIPFSVAMLSSSIFAKLYIQSNKESQIYITLLLSTVNHFTHMNFTFQFTALHELSWLAEL